MRRYAVTIEVDEQALLRKAKDVGVTPEKLIERAVEHSTAGEAIQEALGTEVSVFVPSVDPHEVLENVEWAGQYVEDGYRYAACPFCLRTQPRPGDEGGAGLAGHAPDCRLALALGREES